MGVIAPAVVDIPEDHVLRRKLKLGILPYLILAPDLKRQRLYVTNKYYSWTRDGLAALVGTGLLPPVFSGFADMLQNRQGAEATVRNSLTGLPAWLAVVALICLVILVTLKVVVSKFETEKKAILIDNCLKEFNVIRNNLDRLLQTPNPLPGVIDYQNRIAATIDRLINEESWPFAAPFTNIQTKVDEQTAYYCERYGKDWTAVKETS